MSFSRLTLNTLRQFGLDPLLTVRAIKNLPRYIVDLSKYLILEREGKVVIAPALQDFSADSGSARGHYFWQDLICAKWIQQNRPANHLDLGSRIDGFVAHLLAFMDVEILDIRPLGVDVPGLTSRIVNAQLGLSEVAGKYHSVSSLHSVEHFGLGRYNDPLDSRGHHEGLKNLSAAVAVGGILYVSFPIGNPRVEFNSQRIIYPMWALEMLTNFTLEEFVLIPWVEPPIYGLHPSRIDSDLEGQCGLYKFRRTS